MLALFNHLLLCILKDGSGMKVWLIEDLVNATVYTHNQILFQYLWSSFLDTIIYLFKVKFSQFCL